MRDYCKEGQLAALEKYGFAPLAAATLIPTLVEGAAFLAPVLGRGAMWAAKKSPALFKAMRGSGLVARRGGQIVPGLMRSGRGMKPWTEVASKNWNKFEQGLPGGARYFTEFARGGLGGGARRQALRQGGQHGLARAHLAGQAAVPIGIANSIFSGGKQEE